jgi:transposase InsO family protein
LTSVEVLRAGRAGLRPRGAGPDLSEDITYIWTLEGWLFPAHVDDLFSRRIVGWEMQSHMRTELW